MANKTSIIIKSVGQDNKATSRSVTDVSKNATDQQLKAFAQALNATSTNTYKGSSRVQTTDLDDAEEKLPRNFVFTDKNEQTVQPYVPKSWQNEGTDESLSLNYDGDGTPDINIGSQTADVKTYLWGANEQQGYKFAMGEIYNGNADDFYITVTAAETATYLSESAVITIQSAL